MVGTGATANASQGRSVSISSDGNTIVIGDMFDNSGKGAALIFTRTNGSWSHQGSKLVGDRECWQFKSGNIRCR